VYFKFKLLQTYQRCGHELEISLDLKSS
jgi:hypothetical protein